MPRKSTRRDLSRYTVHMVGNAHIDPVWQWRWEEGRQEVFDTCRAALDRVKDTPGFVFSRSSAITYQWIEEYEPKLFAEIKRAIARGHWSIVNGWWEQPDCNIPGGESLVRHGLYGQRYFLSRFGIKARTGWNVDTFGHAGTLPQILLKQGMDRYCFFRPDPHEKELPGNLFWWESPDGSRVLAARMPGHYGTWSNEIEGRIYEAAEQTVKGLTDTMNFYGVGNHGGGPTLENIASIKKVDADPKGPHVIFSSADRFFDAIWDKAGKFPVVSEELQYHSRGCFTAVSAIKQHNRKAENMLLQAEKLASLAGHLVGLAYPAADFEHAWKRVLFNQFHDIMAGTSIRPACDDAVEHYEEAEGLAAKAVREAMTRVSGHVNCPGEGRAVVVYNTLSWQRQEVVEAEFTWPSRDEQVKLVDEGGKDVAFQVLHTNISGRGTTIRVAFLADLPACGYRAYRLAHGVAAAQSVPFQVGPEFLESDLFRLEFDPRSGYLTRLADKRSGTEMLSAPANVPLVMHDPSDTWSHGVPSFREEIGRFEGEAGIQVVEVGPVRARVLAVMEFGESTLVQDIRLYRGVPRIDVVLTVDYHGEHEFLKLSFPTTVSEATATYESAYGFAVREANGTEEPAQKWADVSGVLPGGAAGGLAVLNDGRYGYDIAEGELRLSVLRTPIYCFHEPEVQDDRKRYEFTDQGMQSFTYALAPHAGDWRQGDVVRQAQQLNHPCLLREEPTHKGKLPPVFSLAGLEGDGVVLEVIKQHEDGQGLVLRAYEAHGVAAEAVLRLAGQDPVALSFKPGEIKTLLVGAAGCREVDMLEL
jgi:alpha-mannosidase